MTEVYPTDSKLQAKGADGGIRDAATGLTYPGKYEDPHYIAVYKALYALARQIAALGMEVYKDGDLTFGVRVGKFFDGDTLRTFAAVEDQALTNNATNYIYVTAAGVLTVNTTGFPVPSVTPHIRLATIATGTASTSGTTGGYLPDPAEGDYTDQRMTSLLTICSGLTAADMAEAAAFFQSTDITGAEAETLTDLSNADALHLHSTDGLAALCVTAAKLAADAVETAKVKDRNITDIKRAHMTQEENTDTGVSPNVLTEAESRKVFSNRLAYAMNCHQLPTDPTPGVSYTFCVRDADGVKVTAGTNNKIWLAGTYTKVGGYVSSTDTGATIVLVAHSNSTWWAVSLIGTWSVETT